MGTLPVASNFIFDWTAQDGHALSEAGWIRPQVAADRAAARRPCLHGLAGISRGLRAADNAHTTGRSLPQPPSQSHEPQSLNRMARSAAPTVLSASKSAECPSVPHDDHETLI